jgi:aminoglycoside phosphotransferase (APT) family kinase protein
VRGFWHVRRLTGSRNHVRSLSFPTRTMAATDEPRAVRAGEELDPERLRAFLAAHVPGASGSIEVQQFPGGYSNLTYLVRAGEREWVLRRPPAGASVRGGHDMLREYRLLSRLSPVYPKAPRPVAACEDPSVLGAPFYLMERVHGVILRRTTPLDDTLDVRALSEALVDTLAELHAVDVDAAGLSDLGRPDGYAKRQVRGWTERWEASRGEAVPGVDATAAWLAQQEWPTARAAIVHNDFKYDNVVLDPADLTKVRAVLDWEMATLGDPVSDLGMTLAYWFEPGETEMVGPAAFGPTALPGNLTREEIVQRYATRSGRTVDDVVFHYVLGLFKVAVIAQQIYFRYRQGLTQDERFAGLGFAVALLAQVAVRAVDRKRISGLLD